MLIALRIFYALACGLYIAAAVQYIRSFSPRGAAPRRRRLVLLHLAMLVQLVGIVTYTIFLRQAPFSGIFQGLTFASFVLAAQFVLMFRSVEDDRSAGMIIIPLAALFQLLGVFTPLVPLGDPSLAPNPWFILHAALGLFACAAFSVAFATAILYILLHREIKSKRLGRFFERLPSLGELDHLTWRGVAVGFSTLTASICLGMIWSYFRTGRLLQMDPKEIFTLANWVLYAFYLHSRFSRGWRGKRAAWLAVAGFGLLIFNLLVVTLVLSRTHAYM